MHAGTRGFTLIEQLTAIAVAGILVGVGTPALAGLIARSSVQASESSLVAALHFAREAAVRADTHSVLCPSSDGRHCGKGAAWQDGWIVGYDRDHDGAPDGAILATGEPLPTTVAIRGSGARRTIRFRADGSAPGSNLTLLVCRRGSAYGASRVLLANSGRVRVAAASHAQGLACLE